jgi:hypothetical protein
MVEPRAEHPLQGRADGEQHVAQTVCGAVDIMGEVVVVAPQYPQLLERLVAELEPVQPSRVGARGVGQHEAVAAVGLRLARIKLRGAAHH